MAWTVELTRTAKRQLARLDPRSRGKRLSHGMRALWRYRVGDYRLICDVRRTELVVLVVTIGHRSEVYQG